MAGPRYLPRRRGGVLARLADRGTANPRPLGVLLLPRVLERFELRERAEQLLAAPGVVAVDPAHVSYRALARLSEPVMAGLAAGQARRMAFPGTPCAILLFHPLQYPVARALIAEYRNVRLWYGDPPVPLDPDPPRRLARRIAELDEMASMRAEWRFDTGPEPERNTPVWERLEALGVESGRLGSERADVIRAWRGDA